MNVISQYLSDDGKRQADVVKVGKRLLVNLYFGKKPDGSMVLTEERDVSNHTVQYAENCAENYVQYIF
jgi:hypothetical protein